MKKLTVTSLVIILMLVSFVTTAFAIDEPPPAVTPWHRDLGDGLVFHYRPKYEHYRPDEFSEGTPTDFKERGYPATGLYLNGELIYTVEERLRGLLYFSNDGMTFLNVRWTVPAGGIPGASWREQELPTPAVSFFEQGSLVHTFYVIDLVIDIDSINFSGAGAQWDHQQLRYHDRENNTLRVTTLDTRDITFDLSTGLILSIEPNIEISGLLGISIMDMESPDYGTNINIIGIVVATVNVLLVLGVIILLVLMKRRRKSKNEEE